MIPTNARKKFRIDVTPSDRQLWAIGMVVVQWSSVENFITVFVHSFTDQNDPNDPVRREFDSTRSLQRRLAFWEQLTKERIQPVWQQQMLQLISETRQLADSRDKIVHGIWADKENASVVGEEAHGPFNWSKPGHRFTWKLDYGSILEVALRIDRLQASMHELIMNAYGPNPERKFVTFSAALARIMAPTNETATAGD